MGDKEKHGDSYTRLYKTWADMKTRCYTESCRSYERYGGRGITVCDEWRNSYIAFRDWALSNGYNDNLTIERVNVNGNYEPSNCKFITWEEQYDNRRSNKTFKATSPKGEVHYAKNCAKFSREHGLNSKMVHRVLKGDRNSHRDWKFQYV